MAMSRISVFLVAFCVCAPAQDRVAVDEILTLLAIGVPAADVDDLVRRRGGPATVQEDDLLAVRQAGGSDALQRRLEKRLRAHQRLRDLAARFDVWQHRSSGISMLYPKGWIVSPSIEKGRALITIQRDAASPRAWFETPRMFVWVQRGTPFPRGSQPELAAKIARLVGVRLAKSGMEPKPVGTGLAKIGTHPTPEHRMAATVPEVKFQGQLVIRTRVMDDGTVITAGYSCSEGDEESVRALFQELARSLSVAAR